MGRFSFIGDLVKDSSKAAKEVIENGGGSANQRAKMIKNCVNNVQSNLGKGQARAVSEMGEDSGKALKEGIQTALNKTKANTAQNALNRTARQGNSAVQKSKEIIDNKRVNKVIDGHNAKQRDVEMQTIVNNVKDRNINRVPKDHETARRAVEQANETVRNTRIIHEPEVNPMHTPKNVTYSYQNKANTANTNNTTPKNIINQEVEPKFGFDTSSQTVPEVEPELKTGNSPEPKNTTSQSTPKEKERINRAFEKVPESMRDTFIGGISDSYKGIQDGQGIFEAIGNAHKNDDGSINWRRAAGTFMTASAAARIASGGGVYKDRYGNPNLIGVPFI
jgi:hypothetical protein